MDKKVLFKKIINLLKHEKFLILLTLVLSLITTIISLLLPFIFGKAIDLIIGINNVNFSKINNYTILLVVIILCYSILNWITNLINNKIAYNTIRTIRNRLFTKLERLPISFLDQKSTGEVVNTIITDTEVLGEGILMTLTQFFTSIITIIGVIVLMFILNLYIALFVILFTPLSLFVAKWISKNSFNLFKEQADKRGIQTSLIDEFIGNQKIIQSLSYENNAYKRFVVQNESLANTSLKATFITSLVNPSTRFINALIYAGVALIGSLIIINNPLALTIGSISALLGYANQFSKPFNEITSVIAELSNAFACSERIFMFLETSEEKDDGIIDSLNEIETISIENLEFSYNKNNKLIENFNIDVKNGERIAIVGPTGCGKTTIINLLMRFYEKDNGDIKINEQSIYNMKRKTLRKNIGMVLQDTWLMNDTIKNNITMNKEYPFKDIINVCKKCHLLSYINALPQGFDTIINEGGTNLSNGQKQLICIARVMLKNPNILILDEATSDIDTRTEILVQKAFNQLMKNKTSFIVAHRLQTIVDADKIIVMNHGKIVEIGRHDQLISNDGFYKEIFKAQFQN